MKSKFKPIGYTSCLEVSFRNGSCRTTNAHADPEEFHTDCKGRRRHHQRTPVKMRRDDKNKWRCLSAPL